MPALPPWVSPSNGVTILTALGHGRASARRKLDLARDLGWTTRAVEAAVQQARLEGAPIASDETGYWLGSAEEVDECARRLRSRYIHQAITARSLRRTAQRMRGYQQVEIWAA